MKTHVSTLVAVNMYGHFGARLQLPACGQLVVLYISPDDVVVLASGHSLRELAGVIGIEFPANLLGIIAGQPNPYLDPIERPGVGTPDGSEDQRVRLGPLATESAVRGRCGEES
jgi:hypothetical protein